MTGVSGNSRPVGPECKLLPAAYGLGQQLALRSNRSTVSLYPSQQLYTVACGEGKNCFHMVNNNLTLCERVYFFLLPCDLHQTSLRELVKDQGRIQGFKLQEAKLYEARGEGEAPEFYKSRSTYMYPIYSHF